MGKKNWIEFGNQENVDEDNIVKFEISDRIRNCHLYGSPLEDNYKAHSIERNRPSGLETYAIFR